MMYKSVITLPTELICLILFYVEDHTDLLNLALTARRFSEIIIPNYINYHTLSCYFDRGDFWKFMADSAQSVACKYVTNLYIVDDRTSQKNRGIRNANGTKLKSLVHIPKSFKKSGSSDCYQACKHLCAAIRQMPYLLDWAIDWSRNANEAKQIFEALVSAKPILKKLVIAYSPSSSQSRSSSLPISILLGLDFSALTTFDFSSTPLSGDDCIIDILLSAPNLNTINIHHAFNFSRALEESSWPHLETLRLGRKVQLFPPYHTVLAADEDGTGYEYRQIQWTSNEKRELFTSFLRRHPSLQHLYLPLWTQLSDCFPIEEGLCPNIKALETSPVVPGRTGEAATAVVGQLELPSSFASQLTHISTIFHESLTRCLERHNLSNLTSFVISIPMEKADHFEALLRTMPRVTKLRIEILGTGMQLLIWIDAIIQALLSVSPPLTHLLSLLDEIDVDQQMGRDLVHKIASNIPTLEYMTGYMYRQRSVLKIMRAPNTNTYKGFRQVSPHQDVIDLDHHLTTWGVFWV